MNKSHKILIKKAKDLISNGETEKAIEFLTIEFSKNEEYVSLQDQLVLISNQFKEFRKSERIGILNPNDNSIAIINSNLINLLNESDKNISKKTGEYENPIKNLRRRLFMAKSPEEIERIKFEAEIERKKNPENFEAHQLYNTAKTSYEWEVRQHSGKGDLVQGDKNRKGSGAGCVGEISIMSIIVALLIFIFVVGGIIWGIVELIKWIF